ncbi:MAG: hypothetical protein ACRCVW_02400 [Brevinema sp.]
MKKLFLFLILLPAVSTKANFKFAFVGGDNFNLSSTMTKYGLGVPVIHYSVWESRAFTVISDSPYWVTRIEVWNNKHTWAIGAERIH